MASLSYTTFEFHMLRNSTRRRKLSRLVTRFQRFDGEAQINDLQPPAVKLDGDTLTPLKSVEKTRVKPSPKKHNPKIRDREKENHEKYDFHPFETLLSLMACSEQHKQSMMLSVRKLRGELLELLTQVSVGSAVTGHVLLFYVVCKVASRRIPFCEDMFCESALSLSLIWLSWAVSRLMDAIAAVNRKSVKEEETKNRVVRRIKQVLYRAATVIAMFLLWIC